MPRDLRIEVPAYVGEKNCSSDRKCLADRSLGKESPQGWLGWPQQKRFALVLTHDVENWIGLSKVYELMNLEENLGFSHRLILFLKEVILPG